VSTGPWATTDDTVQLGIHQQKHQTMSGRLRDTCLAERGRHLGPRKRSRASNRALDRTPPLAENRVIETHSAKVRRADREHSMAGELQQPSNVLRANEVPGRSQHVSTENAAGVEGAVERGLGRLWKPEGEGPEGWRVILRLDRPEPAHDIFGLATRRADEPLVVQARTKNVRA
jgi:hypothetical protein